jgi:hypothetical protein
MQGSPPPPYNRLVYNPPPVQREREKDERGVYVSMEACLGTFVVFAILFLLVLLVVQVSRTNSLLQSLFYHQVSCTTRQQPSMSRYHQ